MKTLIFITTLFLTSFFCVSCEHERQGPEPTKPVALNTDSFLYAQSFLPESYNWYQQNDSIRPSSSASPHSKYFRVRFNRLANDALTESGKLPAGSAFPEGSMIIKELYDTTTSSVKYLAILYKDKTNINQANGWLWLETKGNGEQYISTNEKGAQCVNCHSAGRDHVRLFDIF